MHARDKLVARESNSLAANRLRSSVDAQALQHHSTSACLTTNRAFVHAYRFRFRANVDSACVLRFRMRPLDGAAAPPDVVSMPFAEPGAVAAAVNYERGVERGIKPLADLMFTLPKL